MYQYVFYVLYVSERKKCGEQERRVGTCMTHWADRREVTSLKSQANQPTVAKVVAAATTVMAGWLAGCCANPITYESSS